MATILIKLDDESQFDASKNVITYKDATEKRWKEVFSKLKIGDKCLFHASSETLYVGDFASKVAGVSVSFDNIKTVKILYDNLMRIAAFNPEKNAQFKRPAGPIYIEDPMNLNEIYNCAIEKKFIAFYLAHESNLEKLKIKLNHGDRVVSLTTTNYIKELLEFVNGKLHKLNLGPGLFNAKGKSLGQVHTEIEKLKRPNHLVNVYRVMANILVGEPHKFRSFNDYYNLIHNKDLFKRIHKNSLTNLASESQNNSTSMEDKRNKNIILFGPPGTGKTFHSITHAVAIIDEKNTEDLISQSQTEEGRAALKKRYDELVDSGNIVFTTFHQSLGYEDFIEGIKPLEPSPDKPMQYDVVDGLFKRICNKAEERLVANESSGSTFEEVLEKLEADWRLNPSMPFELTKEGSAFTLSEFKTKNIPFKKASGGTAHSLSKKTLKDLYLGIREKYPSGLRIYYQSVLGKLKVLRSEPTQLGDDKSKIPNKFVLIIDEINRGNVSQIFGELITLIEPDKRMSAKEEISVTLPYSGEEFGVPQNVYVIGTMNTADRSVEALDTALRRRFSFIPMNPEYVNLPNDCDGIDIQLLLTTVNNRLTVLKDKDHTIGHAWLWNVNSLESLKSVFKDKIIPLLQEFFYNDYEKLGLVLGKQFIIEAQRVDSNLFAPFDEGTGIGNQYLNKRIYTISEPNKWTVNAFKSIYE